MHGYASDNFGNGISFPDMAEKFISQTFSFGGSGYKTGNINKRYRRRDNLLCCVHILKHRQAAIGYGNHASIWLDSCKWIIRRQNIIICQGVK